jgi:hypothetical protein
MASKNIEKRGKDFIMISFAVLFVVLFLSMLLNYMVADIENAAGFAVVVKCVFAAAVVLTIIFYQTARLKQYVRDKAFIILLNLFAAIDFLFIFTGTGGNNVNVFDIVTTLYIVISVSVLIWIIFWLVKKNANESFYAFLNELRISLIVMTGIILTEGVFTAAKIAASNGADGLPETALISTYMFFASAALCAQLTHVALLNVKNLTAKIAAIVMLFSGLIYGISLLPFLVGLGVSLSGNALVILAAVFAAATVTLFCISLYRAGKAENRKIHVKSAVLTAAGFAMSLLFIKGMTDISGGLKTAFYIISVVLSVGFLIFILATYKYERELIKDAEAEETDDAVIEPPIEDCGGEFVGNNAPDGPFAGRIEDPDGRFTDGIEDSDGRFTGQIEAPDVQTAPNETYAHQNDIQIQDPTVEDK